jgi:GNAT superfamily N-acetyltransferase
MCCWNCSSVCWKLWPTGVFRRFELPVISSMELQKGLEMDEVRYIDVWQQATEQDQQDARVLWIEQGAITDEAAIKERLPQLCVLARDANDKLLAITTAYEHHSQRLGNDFYAMRMFVGEDARRMQIGFHLLHKLIQALEARFVTGQQTRCIGVLFELENQAVQKARPQAIWPTTGFVYVGNNAKGDHIRVRYFKDACIA